MKLKSSYKSAKFMQNYKDHKKLQSSYKDIKFIKNYKVSIKVQSWQKTTKVQIKQQGLKKTTKFEQFCKIYIILQNFQKLQSLHNTTKLK